MKKRLALGLAVVSISATATVVFAGAKAATGINGSMHDINTFAGYKHDSMKRTCVFCHTPHNALKGNTDGLSPLWNHADNKLDLSGKAYAWVAPANKGIAMATDPLIGPSRLCMACHDGSTAVDAHGSAAKGDVAGTTVMTASYTDALGNTAKRYITDLQVTHPIGFLYQDAFDARGTAELVPSSHGFIAAPIPADWDTTYTKRSIAESSKKISDVLYNGYFTCASCHDVHNTVNAKPDPATDVQYNYFIYAQQEGSAICLSCHIK